MRPTRASQIASDSMTTNETSSLPVTPVTRVVPTGREIDAPADTSTRGLIIVRSAPVSSRRFAFALPLIFTSTMIRWPGVYLIVVPPALGAPGGPPGPPAVAARRPNPAPEPAGAGVGAPAGALRRPTGTARARYSCGTPAIPPTQGGVAG